MQKQRVTTKKQKKKKNTHKNRIDEIVKRLHSQFKYYKTKNMQLENGTKMKQKIQKKITRKF